MSKKGLRIVIFSKTTSSLGWGLGQDARIIEQVLRESVIGGIVRIDSIDHIDPMTFYGGSRKPRPVDIHIHLEIPCRAAWKWAKYNIVMVNPEWWPKYALDWTFHEKTGADCFIFKSEHAAQLFNVDGKRKRVIPWRTNPSRQIGLSNLRSISTKRKEFLYLVGASANKLMAAESVCRFWKESWPTLHIVGVEGVLEKLKQVGLSKNITYTLPFQNDSDRIAFQTEFLYHVAASSAEGFGYTFHEAAALGAIPLWNNLPVYSEYMGDILGTLGRIESSALLESTSYMDRFHSFTETALQNGVESILSMSDDDIVRIRGQLLHRSTVRTNEFRQKWKSTIGSLFTRLRNMPTIQMPPARLSIEDLPHVAILTITRNRPKWFANMARNILLSDYPSDKLSWIVADDGDAVSGGRIDEQIAKFQSKNPHIQVKYLSISKPIALGAKRNKTCELAPSEASVFMIMDDDDHYPSGSIASRVAWLRATGSECVYCSTLPMYDCKNYISAINVPPLILSPAERISEATLAFTRKFWEEGKFPQNVSIAEGEGFISGREHQTVEIPPEGIIVSFLHGKNATSRRIPETSEQNGCHYGFDDDYFTYISGLAMHGGDHSTQ